MRKLSRYMKPFLIPIILVVILVFLEVLTELKLPDLMSEIVDQGIVRGDIGFIWKTGGLMLLVAFGGLLCAILGNYLGAKASTGFGRDLRNALFSHVEEFSLEEFNKFGTASLITRTTNDIQQVQGVFLMILRMVIRAPMMAVGGVLMALRKDAQLAWMLVGVLPLVAAVIAIVAVKGVPLFKILQKKLDSLNRVLREQLMGVRVIRAFDRGDFEEERFREANQDLTSTALRVNRIMAVLMPLMSLLLNLTTITIIWFGSHRIDAGYMQVGDMMAFLQYAIQILMSLVMFSMIFVMLPRASASAERINDVLNTVPAIRDPEQPIIPERNEGVVQFENVTFSYPGAEAPVLHDISFTAKPGEVTAVIGGTGSGKSTLLDLIPRFYDVNEGRITLDGVDIRDMTQEELRSRIGYIPQKAVLFSGTISQNIRRGKQTATEEEVKRAAQVAQAADFIKEREDGYESYISQGGTNVSGGQKQRLSIARALVRQPRVYLLDDTFSALDYKTDARLRTEFRKAAADSTIIVVAQRISTVLHAEQIIVLEAGRVVGRGTHDELMESCQVYKEIVASQFSEEAVS